MRQHKVISEAEQGFLLTDIMIVIDPVIKQGFVYDR